MKVQNNSMDAWDYTLQQDLSNNPNYFLEKLVVFYGSESSSIRHCGKAKMDSDPRALYMERSGFEPIGIINGSEIVGSVIMVYGIDHIYFNCLKLFNIFCLYGNCEKVRW